MCFGPVLTESNWFHKFDEDSALELGRVLVVGVGQAREVMVIIEFTGNHLDSLRFNSHLC